MSDCLILCATARLAQTLRTTAPAGASVWRTPWALTPGQWFAELADEALLTGLADLPRALDPFAERLLWEKLVAGGLSDAAPLFDIEGMAALAAEAQSLCRVWGLEAGGGAVSDEARCFGAWQTEFTRLCHARGWIDAAGLYRRLIGLIAEGHFALPAKVRLLGFDRPTPLEQALLAALSARGVVVEMSAFFPVDRGQAQVMACPDVIGECAQAVAWAQRQLAISPARRVAIVAPDLAGVRDRLEAMLDDALHPALIRPDAAEVPRCFNFSLGRALADLPLVRSALDLLFLASSRSKVEQSRLSALLLGAGWGAAEGEADGRARLDVAMRRDLPYFTTLPALLRLAERLAEVEPLCPQSMQALADCLAALGQAPRKGLPSQWADVFRRALAGGGWPGDRALSSHEYQTHRAFGEVLGALGRLDAVLGSVPMSEAVRRLSQLCRQRVFQPETRIEPAVQVLGVLESAGLHFDALWVMGMNDDRWPPPPRPNPLLPIERQRQLGSAHASAEVELDFARRVHERLCHSAPELTFSWSRADGNRVLRPSPLLAGLPETAAGVLDASPIMQRSSGTGDIEQLLDDQAPPVADGERVAGGSWLLRAQAICPAWAYFRFRLGAEAMKTAVEGLDPAARGTLVHQALEAFWKAVQTSANLVAFDEAVLSRAIDEAVAQALAGYEHDRRLSLPPHFRQLEAARLARLLGGWLAFERERGEPFAVVACEAAAKVEIEGIQVNLVVDRIDRLGDGRQVILDYKTGASIDTRNWAGDRLTEPQLPIYAALVGGEVAAVAFAKVLLDKPAFAGVAESAGMLPGVPGLGDDKQKIFDAGRFPDWAAVVAHWDDRLHAVAREVRAGVAGVMVADEKDLMYCDVLPLLRLAERRRLLAEAMARG